MASPSKFYFTALPREVVEILVKDLEKEYDNKCEPSLLHGQVEHNKLRSSQNAWVPDTHWAAGFVMHYVRLANSTNFMFDINNIDGGNLQYTRYGPGETYGWHIDHGILDVSDAEQSNSSRDYRKRVVGEEQRKLSFSLQLSDADDYEGGNFQLMDDNDDMSIAPRQLGSLIVFDSRCKHRVRPVKSGIRRSLVGWVMGPRWR